MIYSNFVNVIESEMQMDGKYKFTADLCMKPPIYAWRIAFLDEKCRMRERRKYNA